MSFRVDFSNNRKKEDEYENVSQRKTRPDGRQ